MSRSNKYEITVSGSRQYTVTLILNREQEVQVHCTCSAFSQWYGDDCTHFYAAALGLAEQQRLMRFEADTGGDYAYRQMLWSLKSAKSDRALKIRQDLEYMLVNDKLYPEQVYTQLQTLLATTSNSRMDSTKSWR